MLVFLRDCSYKLLILKQVTTKLRSNGVQIEAVLLWSVLLDLREQQSGRLSPKSELMIHLSVGRIPITLYFPKSVFVLYRQKNKLSRIRPRCFMVN